MAVVKVKIELVELTVVFEPMPAEQPDQRDTIEIGAIFADSVDIIELVSDEVFDKIMNKVESGDVL
jgi:hypothetical protein